MPQIIRAWSLSLVLVASVCGGLSAQNPGLEDLDQATVLKLTAQSPSDWAKVIDLCESALAKGLDEDHKKFAGQLLASTRIRRGIFVGEQVFRQIPPSPMWPQYRVVALRDLERALELDPDQVEALIMVARLNLLPEGDAKRASGALDKAIELSKDDPASKARGLVLKATIEENDEAKLALLDEAVKANPESADALRMRGAVHADANRLDKAKADLRKAAELEPEQPVALLSLGMVLMEEAMKLDPAAEKAEEKQKTLLDEALDLFKKTAQLAPKAAQPWIQMGQIYAMKSEFKPALEALNKAYQLEPGKVATLLLRASVQQELGDNEAALADVDRALELNPNMEDEMKGRVMKFRAMLLANRGDFTAAIKELQELEKSFPKDLAVILQLGTFYTSQENYAEAIKNYDKVLKSDPNNAAALRLRGDAYLSIGKHPEAIADLEKAAQLMPDDAGTLNNLAWVLCTSPTDGLRNAKRAIEIATKACKLTDYKAAHILSTLAAAYAESGDMKTAIEWSEKAVKLAESQPDGDPETLQHLKEELESYKQGKPWRELMTAPEPKGEQKKPGTEKKPGAEKKPEAAKKQEPAKAEEKKP